MKNKKYFCYEIYKNISIWSTQNGVKYNPCSIYNGSYATTDTVDIGQVWNNPAHQDLKRCVETDTPISGCQVCYDEEAVGRKSRRQSVKQTWEDFLHDTKNRNEFFIKAKDTFDKKIFKQPVYPKGSNYFYGLLNETDKGKLKIDILKTLGVNAKNLTPLAITGLNTLASLPVATVTMMLQSTPANADEANMQLEDFAKLNQGTTNVDKALYDD